MNKFNSFFKVVFTVAIFMVFVNFAQAQKLYMYIFYQQDPSVGCLDDKATMEKLAAEIQTAVPGMTVVKKVFTADQMTKSKIESELNSISNHSNDVIWLYYTGHGSNYDGWPQSDETSLPITWVFDKFKAKNPRLSIAQYDCCNYRSNEVPTRSDIQPKSNMKYLLLGSRGHIITTSSSPTEYSYGSQGAGSIYTNKFYDAFHEKMKWDEVLNQTKSQVNSWASSQNPQKRQNPIYDWKDGGNLIQTAAPSIKVRNGDTWESIVNEWNSNPDNSNKQITVAELKSWNQGKSLTAGTKIEIKK